MNLPGAELLLRYGGISLVVASAIFFVSTAISRGWIGPVAQLVIATLTSFAFIGQSFRFSEARRPWSITLAIGGTAALFVSGVVGFLGLELLTFTSAIAWLLASVGLFLVLSRLHDAESIAIASVPAALVGALLLFEGEFYEPMWLCLIGAIYVLAVTITTHGRSWFNARALGVSTGAFLAGSAVLDTIWSNDANLLVLATISIASVLVAAASQSIDFVAEEAADKPNPFALVEARFAALTIPYITAIAIGIAIGFNLFPVNPLWVGVVVASGLGLVVAAMGRLPQTMRLLHIAGALSGVTYSFVGVADGPVLLVAFLGQTVMAGWLAHRFESTDMRVLAGLFAGVTAVWTVGYLTFGLAGGLTSGESIAVLLVIIASGFGAKVLRDNSRFGEAWFIPWTMTMAWVVGTFSNAPQGQMIITLLWAMLGAAMLVVGSKVVERQVLSVGLFTLTLTAGKLIFVDLVAVDVLWRAGLFFVVGMLFMRLAFMLPKLVNEPDAKPHLNLDEDAAAPEPDLVNSGGGLG